MTHLKLREVVDESAIFISSFSPTPTSFLLVLHLHNQSINQSISRLIHHSPLLLDQDGRELKKRQSDWKPSIHSFIPIRFVLKQTNLPAINKQTNKQKAKQTLSNLTMLAIATQMEGYAGLSSPSANHPDAISPSDSLPLPTDHPSRAAVPRPLDLTNGSSSFQSIETSPYTGKDGKQKKKGPKQPQSPLTSPSAVHDAFGAQGYFEQDHSNVGRIGDGPLSPASVEFDPNCCSPSAVGTQHQAKDLQEHAAQRNKELQAKQQQSSSSSSSSSSGQSRFPTKILEYKENSDGTISIPTEIITASHSFPAKINNKIDFQTMRLFLTSPLPPGILFQCKMIRNRSGIKNRIYPRYELYFESTNTFLLSSKKKTSNKTSNYVMSMSKKHVNNYSVEYLGKVRGNFSGSEYIMYDDGLNPKYLQHKGDVNGLYAERSKTIREEIGAIFYENNIMGSCPRKSSAAIPAVSIVKSAEVVKGESKEGEEKKKKELKPSIMRRASWADNGKKGSIAARYQALKAASASSSSAADEDENGQKPFVQPTHEDDEMMMCLQNKLPVWNKQLQAYALNFGGRAKIPSVKNFQLINPYKSNHIMLQFGKMDKDVFALDIQHPLSPLQAFGIALSGVDSKLVSD